MKANFVIFSLLMGLMGLIGLTPACNCNPQGQGYSHAYQIDSRAQLIGGPRALGEVGDYMIENDQVRFIVQGPGFSRGFGVYGGSLIDADLVRPPVGVGDQSGGHGKDNFGELFVGIFLEALKPDKVVDPLDPREKKTLPPMEVLNDGSNGEPAELVVRGYGGDFIALTQTLLEQVLGDSRSNPALMFQTFYRLRPGQKYVEIETRIQNVSQTGSRIEFGKVPVIDVDVPTPFGDVALFGAGNHVFMPHEAGYDLRYRLEDVFAQKIPLPALGGLIGDFIASSSADVSYGLVAKRPEDPESNFAYRSRNVFPEAKP